MNVDLGGETGTLQVAQAGGTTLNTGQVSITNAATLVKALNNNRYSIVLTNNDAATPCYVGAAGVTAATGQYLPPGASITFSGTFALYAITATGAITVSYAEEAA